MEIIKETLEASPPSSETLESYLDKTLDGSPPNSPLVAKTLHEHLPDSQSGQTLDGTSVTSPNPAHLPQTLFGSPANSPSPAETLGGSSSNLPLVDQTLGGSSPNAENLGGSSPNSALDGSSPNSAQLALDELGGSETEELNVDDSSNSDNSLASPDEAELYGPEFVHHYHSQDYRHPAMSRRFCSRWSYGNSMPSPLNDTALARQDPPWQGHDPMCDRHDPFSWPENEVSSTTPWPLAVGTRSSFHNDFDPWPMEDESESQISNVVRVFVDVSICGLDISGSSDGGFCVLCAFRNHIEDSLASTTRVISPHKLVNNLSFFSSGFLRYQQEDAHEFLQCFLDRLDSCCTDSKARDKTLSVPNGNFVKQGFGGRLVSKLRCCSCGHCSNTFEPSIDLSLEIDNVDSLTSALKSFTKVEKIEDPETKFTCENCEEEVAVEKQLMLEQPPSVAAFHLKRFKNDGSSVQKIDKHVRFLLELDLLPYTSGHKDNNVGLKYDLYAVVVHIGLSPNSGHYYCFIRSSPDTWYKFNDSEVKRVREDFVLSQDAYILFYAEQGTQWFSNFLETLKPSISSNISSTSPKSVLDGVDHICTSSATAANSGFWKAGVSRVAVYTPTAVHEDDTTTGKLESISAMTVYEDKSHEELRWEDHQLGDKGGPDPAGQSTDTIGFGKKLVEPSDGSRNVAVDGSETEDILRRNTSPLPLVENNTSDGASPEVENQEFTEVGTNSKFTPLTPPRSPSPDTYKEKLPELGFSISRNHLKSVDQVSCKRKLNKDPDDKEVKQARRLCKNMHTSRGSRLLAAMYNSPSEGSQNKKRRRMETSPIAVDNSVMCPVAAGSSR
ncbi:hypothetical protein RJ639_000721 [Escallonia herrerae]|uniref:ubiquitinyl hydrolase 1 n=1 Tax=Escallonia herrerae TaxID=1293975 RepID=A0AA88X7V3_9ASTE|nr:hypothetical protein RJ639_000721 [Escallonia herrerae]